MLCISFFPLVLLLLKVVQEIHPQIGASCFTGLRHLSPITLSRYLALCDTYFSSEYKENSPLISTVIPFIASGFGCISKWLFLSICSTIFKFANISWPSEIYPSASCLKPNLYVNLLFVTKREPSMTVRLDYSLKFCLKWLPLWLPTTTIGKL